MDYKELREERDKRRAYEKIERMRRREELSQRRIEERDKKHQEKYERDERIANDRERRAEKIKQIKEREYERENKKKSCKNCWNLWGGSKENLDKENKMRDINYRIDMCIKEPCALSEEECISFLKNKVQEYKTIMSMSNPIKRTNALHEFEEKYCNRSQLGGGMIGGGVTLNGNETGAGVVLIENYLNRNRSRQEDAVILFRDAKTGKYNDGGGKIDSGETVEQAARRELKEESENLFRLSSKSLSLQLASRYQNYIGFFVRVSTKGGTQSEYYTSNRSSLKNGKNVPHHWVETDRMTRVYVKDLINNDITTKKGDFQVKDVNGNRITIEVRTKEVLREGIKNNIIKMTSPQTLNINPKCKDKEIPHISTICYWT